MTKPLGAHLRVLTVAAIAFAALLPAAAPAGAASDHVLRVGTVQDLDSMNPWNTALETGFEVFTLNYDLLVGFGQNLEPIPGYAESWTRVANPDGKTFTWTFKIPAGMEWSDGQPATAEDARWTLQFVLDASTAGSSVGLGYLDPDLTNAGVTKVEAPDATTLVVTNTDPSSRILQMYIPILPEHVWKGQTLKTVATFANAVPVVGTGPYQAVEWQTGQFVRFARNPHYHGTQGAADQVVLQFFKTGETMVQALKAGDLDYAQGLLPAAFNDLKTQPNITTVNGTTNGWTMLDLNSYDKDIPGGGASTKALRDPAFRDALGYAIDKPQLIDRVLGGYGTPGTTQVPPFQTRWHVEPDHPRTFDIALAASKLTDAGYPLDANGQRLDKEGKPIKLRLYLSNDSPSYAPSAAFIKGWFEQLGIPVSTAVYDDGTLTEKELPPEAGKGDTADWDMIIWGWTGYADPNPLLQNYTTGEIGLTNDSLWSNPTYDQLFAQQNAAATDDQRHALMAQMQNLFYDQAPYHILYYDDTLTAYRTDKFGGWANQPSNGVPLFGYGSIDYTLLTDATAPAPSPSATPIASGSGSSASPGSSPAPGPSVSAAPVTPAPAASSGDATLPIVVIVVVAIAAAAFLLRRRRGHSSEDDDDD
jgi:peptide/nickel transport system substrate-binding protein